MRQPTVLRNQRGFTLIEIIAVLILLGILAAVAVPKYLDMTSEAKEKAVDAAIAELNSRESMIWGKVKLGTSPPSTDAATDSAVLVHSDYDTDLGSKYFWTSGPNADGGTLSFDGGPGVALTRTHATLTSPGRWSR